MGGTKAGGIQTRETNYLLYGPDYYKKIGRLGGLKRVPKGFALMTKEKRSAAGHRGGRISRRAK